MIWLLAVASAVLREASVDIEVDPDSVLEVASQPQNTEGDDEVFFRRMDEARVLSSFRMKAEDAMTDFLIQDHVPGSTAVNVAHTAFLKFVDGVAKGCWENVGVRDELPGCTRIKRRMPGWLSRKTDREAYNWKVVKELLYTRSLQQFLPSFFREKGGARKPALEASFETLGLKICSVVAKAVGIPVAGDGVDAGVADFSAQGHIDKTMESFAGFGFFSSKATRSKALATLIPEAVAHAIALPLANSMIPTAAAADAAGSRGLYVGITHATEAHTIFLQYLGSYLTHDFGDAEGDLLALYTRQYDEVRAGHLDWAQIESMQAEVKEAPASRPRSDATVFGRVFDSIESSYDEAGPLANDALPAEEKVPAPPPRQPVDARKDAVVDPPAPPILVPPPPPLDAQPRPIRQKLPPTPLEAAKAVRNFPPPPPLDAKPTEDVMPKPTVGRTKLLDGIRQGVQLRPTEQVKHKVAGRTKLLDGIRQGVPLRPTEQVKRPPKKDLRGTLMDKIRRGTQLRDTTQFKRKKPVQTVSPLEAKMNERRGFIADPSESASADSNDWTITEKVRNAYSGVVPRAREDEKSGDGGVDSVPKGKSIQEMLDSNVDAAPHARKGAQLTPLNELMGQPMLGPRRLPPLSDRFKTGQGGKRMW